MGVARSSDTRCFGHGGEEEIGGKIGEGRTRGFRAINYRGRVGRGARDGKYPVTSGYTEEEGGGGREEKWIHPRTY